MTEGKTEKMGRWLKPPYSPMNNMEVPPEFANDPKTKNRNPNETLPNDQEKANRQNQPDNETSSNQQATGNHYRELIGDALWRSGIPTVKGWREGVLNTKQHQQQNNQTAAEETDK